MVHRFQHQKAFNSHTQLGATTQKQATGRDSSVITCCKNSNYWKWTLTVQQVFHKNKKRELNSLEKQKITKGLFIWARSTRLAQFPRSRLPTLFFIKILMWWYEASLPSYRDVRFYNRDLGNQDENFPIWTLQSEWPRQNLIALLSQHSSQNGIIFVFYVTPFENYANYLQSYNSRERCKFVLHHFGFVSWISSRSPGLKFPIWTDIKIHPSNRTILWRGFKPEGWVGGILTNGEQQQENWQTARNHVTGTFAHSQMCV